MQTDEATESTVAAEEATTATPAPEAPDGVSPLATGDEPVSASQAPPASTRPRDEKGRFIKADGTPASDAEQAAMEAAELPASPPTAPASAPPPVAPAPKGDPFVFRADGQKIPVPGAFVTAEGHVQIPAEQVPVIRQLLAEGVAHRGSWRQREQDFKAQLEQAGEAGRAQAQKYNAASVMLWDVASQLLAENPRELELLRKELDLTLRSADLNIPKVETRQAPAQPDPEQLERAARQTLAEYVEELLDAPQAKAVYNTPEKRQAVSKRFQRRLAAYFVEQDGGEISLHENVVDEDFIEELNERLAAGKLQSDAEKARQFNAARAVASAAPPVVSTKGPAATGGSGGKTYKTREEYNKAMGLA